MNGAGQGPLVGLKVVELAGIGPAPFCGMVLADLGADVVRVDRPGARAARIAAGIESADPRFDVLHRGRPVVAMDLKSADGRARVLDLVAQADALVEGFRPGVMERLGVGPDACLARNPRLVYGRMTGWGQDGPLAATTGHDVDYLAISGALSAIGARGGEPVVPLNLVADFGGGGMLLLAGVLAALWQAQRTGRGQVVDAAMSDGCALLASLLYGMRAAGAWSLERGANLLDGGAPFYGTYRCADGRHVAVGAIEPQFFTALRDGLGLADEALFDAQLDRARWPAQRTRLADVFATRTRDDWCRAFDGTDACVAPVLDWDEAPAHPHHRARDTFVEVDGVMQPSAAPRFSRTPGRARGVQGEVGVDAVIARWTKGG